MADDRPAPTRRKKLRVMNPTCPFCGELVTATDAAATISYGDTRPVWHNGAWHYFGTAEARVAHERCYEQRADGSPHVPLRSALSAREHE